MYLVEGKERQTYNLLAFMRFSLFTLCTGQSSQPFKRMLTLTWKGGQNSMHKWFQGMPLIFSVVMYRINPREVLWRLLKVGLTAGTLNFYDLYWRLPGTLQITVLFPERNCHMGLANSIWLLPIGSGVTQLN